MIVVFYDLQQIVDYCDVVWVVELFWCGVVVVYVMQVLVGVVVVDYQFVGGFGGGDQLQCVVWCVLGRGGIDVVGWGYW